MNPMDWDWGSIVRVELSDGSLVGVAGPLVWGVAVVGVSAWLLARRPWHSWRKRWKPVSFRLGLIGVECEITPNDESAQVAHQAYVELVTRKAALPFDREHDAISEVYDSWYALFGELRKLARSISARNVRDEEGLCTLLDLLTDVLNRGLRPHLTRWQGPYRIWLSNERQQDRKTPEAVLQRQFPDYEELVASLTATNAMLAELTDKLGRLAHGTGDE